MDSIRIGNPIVVKWAFYFLHGKPIPISNYELELFYHTGRGKTKVTDLTVVETAGNLLIWHFNADAQKCTGNYSLELNVYDNGKSAGSFRYNSAFALYDTGRKRLEPTEVCIKTVQGGSFLIDIEDNLESDNPFAALSANQGRILNERLIDKVDRTQIATVLQVGLVKPDGRTIVINNDGTISAIGGGGGGEDTPLDSPCFFGGSEERILVDEDVAEKILALSVSTTTPIRNTPCVNKYYYIAMSVSNNLNRVLTENTENITGDFVMNPSTFNMVIGGAEKTYKLYEFHLSSDIPLNANLNITLV